MVKGRGAFKEVGQMGFRIIRNSEHSVMPWKNGQGSTSQIDIVPAGASFPEGEFLWRLSSATVATAGPFSLFPDCDRWLVVLSGQGLSLNGKTLGPFSPVQFRGEENIHAELLQNAVVDLGLIYRRDKVQAQMTVVQLAEMTSLELSRDAGSAYVYCVSGKVTCGPQVLSPGDSCFIQDSDLKISCAETRALLILIKIQKR
jgi:environmental stress-induced protein Ves